jgi:hypothetical protein
METLNEQNEQLIKRLTAVESKNAELETRVRTLEGK